MKKNTNKPATVRTPRISDRLDKIIDLIDDLASDATSGDVTPNQVFDRLSKISDQVENLRDAL
jgi:hypothetical protein